MTKVTKETVKEAYRGVIDVQAIMDVLSHVDVDLKGAELFSICRVLNKALEPANIVLDHLTCGYPIEP